jgi:hypothetical protein
MTRQNKGHFANKHPKGTTVAEELRQAIIDQYQEKSITCGKAHFIARRLTISPSEVGKALDLLEYHICNCQLGLFGYNPKKKIVEPASEVSSALKNSIKSYLKNDHIACFDVWQIADEHAISRLACCAACEALKIKISPCQLGAF